VPVASIDIAPPVKIETAGRFVAFQSVTAHRVLEKTPRKTSIKTDNK
jgi:hypothetical protein